LRQKKSARHKKKTENRETKLRSSEKICFTTYDNYVNQSSFEHERILCLFIVEIYYILMYIVRQKKCFFFLLAVMSRQQTSAGPLLHFKNEIMNNLFTGGFFLSLKSKQTNEQAVLLTITQKILGIRNYFEMRRCLREHIVLVSLSLNE
jgi:hypothetical protein